ncbi:MAG: helix-turn-helix domain-containing protein [Oscillospiraceae bacterium]|nr:helix-turn-helix domain-containing protein [Oscillospiraceae bacterium]
MEKRRANPSEDWLRIQVTMKAKPCSKRLEPATVDYLIPTNQGEMLKKARLVAGISLAAMSKLLGVHRTTLTDYEFNRVFIPCEIITRVEKICQLKRYSLFDEYHLFIEKCDEVILDYCGQEGISLYEFLKRIGIERQTVYAWVRKKQCPSRENWLLVKKLKL